MKKLLFSVISFLFVAPLLQAQTTVTITADRDNTLYESGSGSLSNGAGIHTFFGKTNNGLNRRTVLHFDLSTLPSNAIISSATLNIVVNKTGGTTDTAYVHLLNTNWGEGTSNAGNSSDGDGTASASGDATWLHTFFNTSTWTNLGGDFAGRESAKANITGTGTFSFTSAQLAIDVQGWANGTVVNNGWIILGNENVNQSAKRMVSKDNSSSTQRPSLVVTYNLTGITESTESKLIQIYPIPANEYLVIEHRRNMFTNQARVFDAKGKLVMDQDLGMDNRINVQKLNSGIYYLELTTKNGNEKITKKFVKQ